MSDEVDGIIAEPTAPLDYINEELNQHDHDLLEACSLIYNSLYRYFMKKNKKIRRKKNLNDMIVFAISGGGIAVSIITATAYIALVTAGGILLNKLLESLKYGKKLVILKKIIREVKSIIDEIEGYNRINEFKRDRFLNRTNQIHLFITTAGLDV